MQCKPMETRNVFHTVIGNHTSVIGVSPNIQEQASTFWTIEGEIYTHFKYQNYKNLY